MVKIYVETSDAKLISTQLFDGWYAYRQSLDKENYRADVDIVDPSQAHIRIKFQSIFTDVSEQDLEYWDLILLCNGGEPTFVATPAVKSLLQHAKVYLICNSLLGQDHELRDKVIWFSSDIMQCRDIWTRKFYPQYFENFDLMRRPRSGQMVAITGLNRSWRHYVFEMIADKVPSLTMVGKFSQSVSKLTDSQWETTEDQVFRDWVNDRYQDIMLPPQDTYYTQGVNVGIDKKFGRVPPGYFVMPEYFDNHIVVFAETGWQNNELNLTEKALKCFYAGSLPFVFGGANINQLYNSIGFQTAWNLLPDVLQSYDSVLDHAKRHQLAVDALHWLHNNFDSLDHTMLDQKTQHNRTHFLTCHPEYQSVRTLDTAIQRALQ